MAFREGLPPGFRSIIIILLTLAGLPAAQRGWSQDVPLPSQEAAPTLFPFKLGGSQSKLQISGSWSTEISGSLGYGLNTLGGGLYPVAFPGMTAGFNFRQIPNLDVSLWLLDRYFFKTSFVDTSGSQTSSFIPGLNSFVLGYDGRPNEFLQSVRIGNQGVNMGSYDFLSFPDPSAGSIGASARFTSGNGTYETMVRYEPAALHRQLFIGHNEITEQRIAPGSYVIGRFFVLPDADVQNLTVYIEDGTGTLPGNDHHFYREAGPSDVIVSAADGTVTFRRPLVGRALVYYTKNGTPVGSSGLGTNFLPAVKTAGTSDLDLSPSAPLGQFSWGSLDYFVAGTHPFSATREVTVAGRNALLLNNPGEFSPFQADNVYSLGANLPGANSSVSATLVPTGTDGISAATAGTGTEGAAAVLNLPNRLHITVDVNDGSFTVLGYAQTGTRTAIDPRSIASRFPFATLSTIYTPGPGRAPQNASEQLLVRVSTPVTAYQLDANILKDSLRVSRNGASETDYTVDYATGLLTFGSAVADEDVIVVSYRTSLTTKPGGDLLFGLGAAFDLFPFLSLDIGTGLRWAAFSGSYSTEAGTNTGSALLTAGLHYDRGTSQRLKADLQAGISLSSPDTTGTFRLFGMEGDGTTVSLTEGDLFPSSIPAGSTEFSTAPASTFGFVSGNRGELLYKDYHLYTAGGAALQEIGWNVPASQQYASTSGSYTGPYPVLDPSLGVVMVMDYRMSATKDWVGAQIPLSGAPEDLSSAESITFEVKSRSSGSKIAAYLQIGALGENLDGGTTLQSSGSTTVKSFPFNDNGTLLTTTGGASPKTGGTYASEDTNGNGLLDLENPSLVVSAPITFNAGTWSTVTVDLNAADRAKLTHVDAIRIVLINKTGGDIVSTFQVSSFSIAKSPFNVNDNSGAAPFIVQEVNDPQPAGKQLTDLFPEVARTFHPAGQTQKVLEVAWKNAATPSPAWTLTGYPNPAPAEVYKKLEFYLLTTSLTGGTNPTVTMNLVNQDHTGVHVRLPISADDTWHKYSLDLTSGALTEDGHGTGVTASLDTGAARYTVFTISSAGAVNGAIYIDEIHLSQAVVRLSAGVSLDGTYSKSGTIVSLFGLPLVRDLSIHEQATAAGPHFADGFETFPESSSLSSFTRAEGRLPFGRLGVQFGVVSTAARTVLSGGHNLDVPLGPFSVRDSYSQSVGGGRMTFSHSDGIGLSLSSALRVDIQDSSTAIGPNLTQTIETNATTNPSGPLLLSLSASLGNEIAAYNPSSPLYFTNWAETFRLLVPVAQPDTTRSGSLQLDGELTLGPKSRTNTVRISLRPTASYRSTLTTGRTQTNLGGLTLSVPILAGLISPGDLSITPAYSRSFSAAIGSLPNLGYADDLQTYGSSLANARYFFDGIPFAELFSPKTGTEFRNDTAGLAAASYEPRVSITASRRTGSHLSDLFLPAHLSVSMNRILQRTADTVTDFLHWKLQYGTDALNLFGSAGAYPLFKFYRTEEIANNLDLRNTRTGISSVLQNLITLYFRDNRRLQIDHRLDLTQGAVSTVSDRATITYSYRPGLHPTLPYVPEELQRGSYLENTESLTLTTTPDSVSNAYRLTLDHETAMMLPDHGKIGASAGIGLAENRTSAGGRRILFGIQASIGAQLTF